MEADLRASAGAPGLMIAGACMAAALAGFLVPRSGELLQLQPSSAADGITLVGAAVAALLIVRYPKAGLVALALFVYLNLSQVLVRQHELPSLLQWLAFPLALAAFAERASSRRTRTSADGDTTILTLCLGAYTLVVLFSTAVAADRDLADQRGVESLKCLAIYLLALGLATTFDRIQVAVVAMVGAGAAMGGLGVYQVVTGRFENEMGGLARVKNAHIYGDVFEPRIAGVLGDPNFFAQVLVLLFPLALYSAWSTRSRRHRIAAYVAAAIIAAAAILTYSRGAALALGLVLLLILYERGIRRETAGALVAVAIAGTWFLPSEFTRRLETIEQLLPGSDTVIRPDSSFEERKLLTGVAWRMFLDNPLVGVGAGNYTVRYESYADEVGSAAREYDDSAAMHYPHSLPLEIAAETGLFGGVVFLGVVVTCFLYASRARKRFFERDKTGGALLATAFAIGLVGYLVASLILHGHFQRYLWLAFALVAALHRSSEAEVKVEQEPEAVSA